MAGESGEGATEATRARAVARGVARGDASTAGTCDAFGGAGVADGTSVGASVGSGDLGAAGASDAGGSVGAGVVGDSVNVAVAVAVAWTTTVCVGPRFPTSESPAPITNPSTTTAIRIGMSGNPPGGGVDGGRVRRGEESDITQSVRAAKRAYCEMNPKGTSRKTPT